MCVGQMNVLCPENGNIFITVSARSHWDGIIFIWCCHLMCSAANCVGKGNGKMDIIATDGGLHTDGNEKRKSLIFFVVAVIVWTIF